MTIENRDASTGNSVAFYYQTVHRIETRYVKRVFKSPFKVSHALQWLVLLESALQSARPLGIWHPLAVVQLFGAVLLFALVDL